MAKDGSILSRGGKIGDNPLMYLGYQAIPDEDYTLRSYFEMFEKYPDLQKLNAFFPTYMEQFRASPETLCLYDGFDYLEFGKTVEMIGFPGKPRLEVYNSLYGVCKNETIGIRSIPLENLLDMPLVLGRLKHIVFGDKVDVFEFDTVFNLFEFIDGIVWELGFQGTLICEIRR